MCMKYEVFNLNIFEKIQLFFNAIETIQQNSALFNTLHKIYVFVIASFDCTLNYFRACRVDQ